MHGRGRHEGTDVRADAKDEEELDRYAYKVCGKSPRVGRGLPPPRALPLPLSPLI